MHLISERAQKSAEKGGSKMLLTNVLVITGIILCTGYVVSAFSREEADESAENGKTF